MAKKNCTKPKTIINYVVNFQSLLRELFVGATYNYVDSFSRIPFRRTRDKITARVKTVRTL